MEKSQLMNSYKCEFCGKYFKKNWELKQHMRIHYDEKPFKCETCDKTFRVNGNLINHKRIHGDIKAFNCDFCGKSYKQKQTLNQHLKIHTGDKPFLCDLCNKSFVRKSTLNVHLLHCSSKRKLSQIQNNPEKYKSESCENKFQKVTAPESHNSAKQHQCKTCKKSFNRKFNLHEHEKIHTGIKDHNCDDCGKSFGRKTLLRRHTLKIHGQCNEKPFKCELCPKSFQHDRNLLTHFEIHSLLD